MKCPQCGQWNRASLPRCMKCGFELDSLQESEPAWRTTLRDGQKPPEYYRMDDFGQSDAEPDIRDDLAQEMQELKARKAEGARLQRRIRQRAAAREDKPSSVVIHAQPASGGGRGETRDRTVRKTNGSRTLVIQSLPEEEVLDDSRNYDPLWAEAKAYDTYWRTNAHTQDFTGVMPKRRNPRRRLMRFLIIFLFLLLLGIAAYFGYHYFRQKALEEKEVSRPTVVASITDDLTSHTISIPGTDGTQIYIRELHSSYVVTDGFATITIPDHTWYDNVLDFLQETMEVTLTPYMKTSTGQQKPMDTITYSIDIPESPITLISPDSFRTNVSSTMYTLSFEVRPGSLVYVNDVDVSDTVNSETGVFSYNATVQPIGDNVFRVRCRSQYCRESSLDVVLYREPQEIPLDLAADTYTSYSAEYMKVSCTTLPGAEITVESPYSDLNITNLDTTGVFSFYAHFDHIGYNTIIIRAQYPGKKDSVIEYPIYYLPPASTYTPKAWPLNESGYSELVSNIAYRAEHTQVYVVIGILDHFESEKPQRAVFYTSDDGKSRPVLLENYTKTTWEQGRFYRIYADVYSSFDKMPWLYARYTYTY